jgi:septal ring factor EnvC (AmiA/AmiB activator)
MKREEFDAEYDSIIQAIDQIVQEIADVRQMIEAAEGSKVEAKREYETALDAGDERTMKAALGKIRQAAQDRDALIKKLSSGFSDRIAALDARKQLLRQTILPAREAAAAAMRAAQEAKEAADRFTNRCCDLQGQLNTTNEHLTAAMDALGPNVADGRIGTKGQMTYS